ncbi:EDD domain protein, DegV family [Psychrobacillus sp. OK028]|uniref:DegV family protein n=1 Tax=Psychrobacillus sp. OK028 TaxID=1884359 RepID=UPI000882A6E2|nr:DegV family protein [Psychrobacillus sp. OK028]SDN28108.1 EDD domain protein, DegV family [Psychrobacillus sp. OK028]
MTLKKIAWLVDSSAYISNTLKDHPDVYVIPLNIHFGLEQFVDGVDLTPDQLYDRLRNGTEAAKTSQPSAGEFAMLYEKLSKEYDSIIAIHVSKSLSGTLSSSISGAEIAQIQVEFIDSFSLSAGITGLVEKGLQLQEAGQSYQDIATELRDMTSKFRNYILIGNLTQLYKGGRLSSAQFYLGSLLKIKPIIQINTEGELKELDKVRSHKKAIQYLINKAVEAAEKDGLKHVYIMHANAEQQATDLKLAILQQAPNLQFTIGEISTSLAVHAGEDTIALLWYL